MKQLWRITLLGVLILFTLCSTVLASHAEWRDRDYNFGIPRFILVLEPTFTYEGLDVSGINKFTRYPYAVEKINDLLSDHLHALSRHRIVNLDYVLKQIMADAPLSEPYDPQVPGFAAMVKREMGNYVDLILYIDIRNYGWYFEYHNAYRTQETYTDRVYYSRKNLDGTETSGWQDVPRTRYVHHPAGYYISDCAEAAFRLYDAKAGRDVWKYSDARMRRSPPISDGYDPSGPESMVKRIIGDAFKKMPLVL